MFNELTINRNSGQPVSLQIARFVKSEIANNNLAPGEKFPTTKELIKSVGVGPHTVRQAMKRLAQEGLVKSTPKLGTVVCDEALTIVAEGNHDSVKKHPPIKRVRRLGVMGIVQNVGSENRYCVETAEGIASECERLGIVAVMVPNKFMSMSAAEICDELESLGCDGLIWSHNSLPQDESLFDLLDERGIRTIFRRRGQIEDGRSCVDADYDNAGYRTGQYFYQNGITDLLIFSHFDFNTDDADLDMQAFPTMLKSGIQRAFQQNYLDPNIEINIHRNEDEDTSRRIYSKLCQTPGTKGVVFTNGFQLLNYLHHTGLEGYELLRSFKVVAISNLSINRELRGIVGGLDLTVLVDDFKETGRLLVGNIMGTLEGYFNSGTTTLTSVGFMSFDDLFKDLD